MTWVLERSESVLGARLVLLAIANHADERGLNAWPSVDTLAREARMTPRHVQRLLPELEALGELQIDRGAGPRGTHRFRIVPLAQYGLWGDKSTGDNLSPRHLSREGGDILSEKGRQDVTQTVLEPSLEPSREEGAAAPTRAEAATATPSAGKARAHRLPDDFELTPERRQVAEAEAIQDVERTFAKFCDYWRSESGAKARKLDWDATWRNWCRNERDRFYSGQGPRSPAARKTRYEQHMDAIDAS